MSKLKKYEVVGTRGGVEKVRATFEVKSKSDALIYAKRYFGSNYNFKVARKR